MKKYIRGYLHFTRKERYGIAALLILILMINFTPKVLRLFISIPKNDAAFQFALQQLKSAEDSLPKKNLFKKKDHYPYTTLIPYSDIESEDTFSLFYFDPNTLSANGWKKLGVSSKMIKTIQNYINAGGHFKNPEALKNIYGMNEEIFNKLAPYILIEVEEQITNKKTDQPRSAIEINSADSLALLDVKGIGPYLCHKILQMRNGLGGFYSIEQLKEIKNLKPESFESLQKFLFVDTVLIQKIHLNYATSTELAKHSYLNYNQANIIVTYRTQHGPFRNKKDLMNIDLIDEVTYKKLLPYLSLE